MIGAVDLPATQAAHRSHRCQSYDRQQISRYGVITPPGVRLPTVLSSTRSTDRPEFTVISRNLPWCFHHVTPNVEVPNLPVDVDSWGR